MAPSSRYLSRVNEAGLSETAFSQFGSDGFLHLPGFLPPGLHQRLIAFFDERMNDRSDLSDKVVYDHRGQQFVTNLERLCRQPHSAVLELLGYPPLLRLAESICGPDFFLIQEFAVIKNRGDELPVYWHQDMMHQRGGRCFTMGIYLDDADAGDGALRVVASSHRDDRDICDLSREPSVEVPMKARDVLIHDMLLAHCSAPLVKNPIRRVLYFEFLSAAHVAKERIYTDELVNQRLRLLFAAIRHYRSLHPGEPSFHHALPEPDPEDAKRPLPEILDSIHAEWVHARPSTYCFESPVPGNM